MNHPANLEILLVGASCPDIMRLSASGRDIRRRRFGNQPNMRRKKSRFSLRRNGTYKLVAGTGFEPVTFGL
jgi:hypothetical protein